MSPERWYAPIYLFLFIAIVAGFWGVTFWKTQGWADIIQAMANGVVVSAAVTITAREAAEMFAEHFKRMREARGFQRGRKQEWERVSAELRKAANEGRSAQEVLERLTPPDNSQGMPKE